MVTRDIKYTTEDLFFPQDLFDVPLLNQLEDTPEFTDRFTEGVSGSSIIDSMIGGTVMSSNFATGSTGWKLNKDGSIEANTGTFRGSLVANTLHIPDEDTTANSAHIESDGDTFWGCTQTNFTSDNDNAAAYVLKTGQAKFQNVAVGGTTTQFTVNNNGLFTFGDGSDGAHTTTGDENLTADKYYTDLTIADGHTLNPKGYRIFCTGTLTVGGGTSGKIARNGNAGGNGTDAQDTGSPSPGGAAGAALADGYLKGSPAGKAGGVGGISAGGAAGTAGATTSNSLGNNGSAGGAGGTGDFAGGAAGAGGTATASNVKLIANWHLATLLDISSTGSTVKFDNSAGGGSGGGGSGSSGGGGTESGGGGGGSGSGGGIIAIYAKDIVISSGAIIEVNGGAGGNGGNSGYGCQGGGGGAGANGGEIILVYNTLTNNGTIQATAGAAGSGQGGGANGNAGTAGTTTQFEISL